MSNQHQYVQIYESVRMSLHNSNVKRLTQNQSFQWNIIRFAIFQDSFDLNSETQLLSIPGEMYKIKFK